MRNFKKNPRHIYLLSLSILPISSHSNHHVINQPCWLLAEYFQKVQFHIHHVIFRIPYHTYCSSICKPLIIYQMLKIIS
uniref:Uncharacterized protein n=1 Tax=Rhizophora mucronata TaxID=61149 RepID=A0A2P2MT24_RHIMU